MTEVLTTPEGVAAELNRDKPFIQIRDRARPNVEYQQGPAYYDRKGHFAGIAEIPIYFPEPKPVEVRTRDITQRTIGRTAKSVVGKITEEVARLVGDKPSTQAENTAKKRIGRPPSLPESVAKAQRENLRAAAAEQVA